ncbi:MAG: FAD:protein transferase [Frankiaceae bacterium]|nr:FAD:protein transferase [Frankiaceae bacterium]
MPADTATGGRLRRVEHIMGTTFSFDIRDADRLAPGALDEVIAWLHWVDDVFSTYQPGSYISRLGRGEIRIDDCPAEVSGVLDACAALATETDGYFTALPGGRLDPSGYVKGWSIERASQLLRAAGSQQHCVNGGGDVQVAGRASAETPWQVGISDPFRRGEIVAVVSASDQAVATSGTSERGGHVVDPFTGRAAGELASLTVVGPGATLTDAYATAGFAMGLSALDWIDGRAGYSCLAVTASGELLASRGWQQG